MAAIDKTYVYSIKDYKNYIEWAKRQKFACPNGQILDPMNYVYLWDDESLNKRISSGIVLMSTPLAMDYFLLKYCPFDFVQEQLRDSYSPEYVQSVINGVSDYDTFIRDSGIKSKCIEESKFGTKDFLYGLGKRKIDYWIELLHDRYYFSYDEKKDFWVIEGFELGKLGSNVCHKKIKSRKALIRLIKKWQLPKGTVVWWRGRYVGDGLKYKVY